jgi:hypothetical protein
MLPPSDATGLGLSEVWPTYSMSCGGSDRHGRTPTILLPGSHAASLSLSAESFLSEQFRHVRKWWINHPVVNVAVSVGVSLDVRPPWYAK